MKHRRLWTGLLCALLLSPLSADDSTLEKLSQELETIAQRTRRAVVAIDGGVPGEFKATGIIIDPNGLIITCARAIRRRGEVDVQLVDGARYRGTIVARDALNDLAVIAIDAGGLTALEFSERDPHLGEAVMTVGNAFGALDTDFQAAYSVGIISDIYRIDDGYRGYVLETDCAINPGSYGGPLLDVDGKVIGVVNRSFLSSKWLGVCVPARQVAEALPYLRLGATVRHGYLGLQLRETDAGLSVGAIAEAGPNTHLEVGDVLREADGTELTTLGSLRNFLVGLPAGTEFPVRLVRDGQERRSFVHVGLKAGFASELPALGTLAQPQGWAGIRIADGDGCRVDLVAEDSPAEKAGLLAGDLIVACDGATVDSRAALGRHIVGRTIGEVLVLDIEREGFERRLYMTLAEKPAPVAQVEPPVQPEPPTQPGARPYLGIALVDNSLRVSSVAPGGPAEQVGFRPGDEILALATAEGAFVRITTPDQLRTQLGTLGKVGEVLRFRITRGGYEQVLTATLIGVPGEPPVQPTPPQQTAAWLGVSLEESPDFYALDVLAVTPGSPAERAGLRVGDRIFEVNGDEIGELSAMREILQVPAGTVIELAIVRNERVARLEVRLGSAQRTPAPAPQTGQPGFLGVAFASGSLVLEDILPDSPADRAGLRIGDRIVAVAGRQVASVADFDRALNDFSAGQDLPLTVDRNGATVRLSARLVARQGTPAPSEPGPQQPAPPRAFLGVQLDGLVISSIIPGTAAEQAGLQEGDTILAIDGESLDSFEALIANLGGRQPGEQLTMRVERDGASLDINVVLGTRPDDNTPAPPAPPTPPAPAPVPARPVLGVRLEGLRVVGLAAGSGAEAAGLADGDALVGLDGAALENVEDLRAAMAGKRPGDVVTLQATRALTLTLGDYEGRPVLGVSLNGLTVGQILAGSGAEQAGVLSGDVLVAVGDRALASADTLREILGGMAPGAEIGLTVRRSFAVTLGAAETVPGPQVPQVVPTPVPPATPVPSGPLPVTLGLKLTTGMVVQEVSPNGPGDRAGIQVGDTLRNVAREVVESFDDLRRVLAGLEPGQEVRFVVTRSDGETVFGTMTVVAPGSIQPAEPKPAPGPAPSGRPSLGIRLDSSMAVVEVAPNGLLSDDVELGWVLLEANGRGVESFADLRAVLGTMKGGAMLNLTFRDGDTTVQLAIEWPRGNKKAAPSEPSSYLTDCALFYAPQPLVSGFLGVSLQDEDGKVMIVSVIAETEAERIGLRIGDRFAKVGGEDVALVADLIACIKQIPEGKTLSFQIERDGELLDFETKLGRRPEGM